MIQYIVECVAFQLVFLIIYDFFLKKETFFQWNRVYLIGTYVLSIVLPWIKIEALKTKVPEAYYAYPEYLWNANDATTVVATGEAQRFTISWESGILFVGMLLATLYFAFKLYQIQKLRATGKVKNFPNFTRIVVKNSELAFSFFKSIFLGDKVIAREHETIIQHEMVHINQKHSWDLLFFEIMRIIGWFNPLVYVYQSRISELHEFIADAKVAKTNKKEQYEFLLSQVFQTQHISFINQFFKSSLIKKRIVMLQKTKSSQIWRLKYLMVLPLVFALLVYTSCDLYPENLTNGSLEVESVIDMTIQEEKAVFEELKELERTGKYWEFTVKDELSSIKYAKAENGSFIQFDGEKEKINGTMVINSNAPLSKRINELRETIDAKDSLSQLEKGQLAQLIYEVYPEELEGISGEKGTIVFTKNRTKIKYNELVAQRERLLRSADEKNPIIVNLDAQIAALKNSMIQDSQTVPFSSVDEVPVFPGCESKENPRECFRNALDKHIGDNIRYPKEAQKKGIQGRVSVMLTIGADGDIANVRMRGPDKLLEKEAARIISKLPKMKPGIHNKQKVNVAYSIPITFVLGDNVENVTSVNEIANQDIDVPFATVEEVPVFPGCENEDNTRECFQQMMQKHISKNFRYPEEAQKKGIQGRVSVMFTISQDGSIQNVRMRGPDKLLEGEAARIISKLPKMTPGKQKGEVVNVPFSIPITFKLQGFDASDVSSKQNKSNSFQEYGDDVPFAVVEEVPVFPGCENAENTRECFQKMMQKHIGKNFRYPEEAQEKGIQGRVSIMFTISENGMIQKVKMRGPDKLLEAESARIISLLPKMTPGKQKGKAVNVPFSIPITFKLRDKDEVEIFALASNKAQDDKPKQNSLNFKSKYDAEPIYMVDGIEKTKNEMEMISPEDIESINVLKGESAIAVYGKDATNGAVVITLKNEINNINRAKFKGMSVLAKAEDLDSEKRIYGRVTDSAKLPLPGVNILIEGTSKGAVSDFDGNFTIEARRGDVLLFKYIGLPSLKFKITDKNDYQVLVNE